MTSCDGDQGWSSASSSTRDAESGLHNKWQATVESTVFRSEYIAMKQGMEASRGLWYKLRMMGVPIAGPTYTFGNNMSVIHNTQCPDVENNRSRITRTYEHARNNSYELFNFKSQSLN